MMSLCRAGKLNPGSVGSASKFLSRRNLTQAINGANTISRGPLTGCARAELDDERMRVGREIGTASGMRRGEGRQHGVLQASRLARERVADTGSEKRAPLTALSDEEDPRSTAESVRR